MLQKEICHVFFVVPVPREFLSIHLERKGREGGERETNVNVEAFSSRGK